MEPNSCLNCARRNHNKNNPICRDCDKRIEYVNHLEMKLNGTFSYDERERADGGRGSHVLFEQGGGRWMHKKSITRTEAMII